MKITGKIIVWWVAQLGLGWMLYEGLYNENINAQNLVKFYIWFMFISGVIVFLAKETIDDSKRMDLSHVSIHMYVFFLCTYVGAFAYFGWFFYGTLKVITGLLFIIYYNDTKEYRETKTVKS